MSAQLFVEVDPDDVPEATTGRTKKYDNLVQHAFANPGKFFKVVQTFKSKQTASGIRKEYKDYTDAENRVLSITEVQEDGGWHVYLGVVDGTVHEEDGSEPDEDATA